MSASTTTVRRWAPKVQQSRRSPISLSASVRLSASALVNEVFPSGRKVDGVSACELSRARRDGGPLANTARYLLAMSYEDRAKAMTWLRGIVRADRKSTRLNSSHVKISYAVFCLKKK